MFINQLTKRFPRIYKILDNSLLRIILFAISTVFDDFDEDLKEAYANMSLLTAKGFWLDFWGYFFKVDRFYNEADINYRQRIRMSLIGDVSTRKAIYEALKPYSVSEPIIEELYGQITVNDDYGEYDYTNFRKSAFVVRVKYRPLSLGDYNLFINYSNIEVNSYLFNAFKEKYTELRILTTLRDVKMGGIKLILKPE